MVSMVAQNFDTCNIMTLTATIHENIHFYSLSIFSRSEALTFYLISTAFLGQSMSADEHYGRLFYLNLEISTRMLLTLENVFIDVLHTRVVILNQIS